MSVSDGQVALTAAPISLEQLLAVVDGAPVRVSREALQLMEASREALDRAVARGDAVYGVTTGVGHLRDQRLPPEVVHRMQARLLDMHAGAYGEPLRRDEVRAVMTARLVGLTRGGSGAAPRVAEALAGLLNADVVPVVPSTGSVGAGDLGEHAYVALVATGKGRALVDGDIVSGDVALSRAGLEPLRLTGKDGLALISANGVTLGTGALVLRRARRLLSVADTVAAVSMDAFGANASVLAPEVQAAKGLVGQAASATRLRRVLAGSPRCGAAVSVQDPISFRVVPQVHGACADVLGSADRAVTAELNARADNPLASASTGQVLSNGNFHPVLVALAFESLRVAVAHLVQLSERRTGQLWQRAVTALTDLPSGDPSTAPWWAAGLQLRYAAAAGWTRARSLAGPVTLDVPPLDFGQEDHSTNAPAAVRCTQEVLDVAEDVLAIELLNACALLALSPEPAPGPRAADLVAALGRELEGLPAAADRVHERVRAVLPQLCADGPTRRPAARSPASAPGGSPPPRAP